MKKLSRIVSNVEFSGLVKIRDRAIELEKTGKGVIRFEAGEIGFDTPDYIKKGAIDALNRDETHYPPSAGVECLRDAICKKIWRKNKIRADPEKNVCIVNGGTQGLFAGFGSILNPGDEVIVPEPYWPKAIDIIKICDGVPRTILLRDEDFNPELYELEKAITKKTKAIYINTPGNPTGGVFTKQSLDGIAQIARDNDLFVVSDEPYEYFIFSGKHKSIASLPGMKERTITVFTCSKGDAMTGWRIGYTIANENVTNNIKKLVLNTTTGVNTFIQYGAREALRESHAKTIKKMLKEYKKRRDMLVNGLNEIKGFECNIPDGALYAFPNIKGLAENIKSNKSFSRHIANMLLEKAGVACAPGEFFGTNKKWDYYLRFAYSYTGEDEIREAIKRMKKVFNS